MKVERETLPLPCQLTPEEMEQKAILLVRHEDQVEDLKKEAKEINDEYKERIAGHASDLSELRRIIRLRAEDREVECVIVPLVSSGQVATIRTDTAVEVSRRPMTDNEKLQPNLIEVAEEEAKRENGEVEEEDEHSHLIQAVTLADLMFQLDLDLAPGELIALKREQLDEARAWALKNLNLEDIEKRKKAPKFLLELLQSVEETRAARAERAMLQNRCRTLLQEAGEIVDDMAIMDWSPEQVNEATDYAQSLIEAGKNKEAPSPERPGFLPPVVAPPPDSEPEPAAV
jgi:uncharacterized protein (UPF0335 family)